MQHESLLVSARVYGTAENGLSAAPFPADNHVPKPLVQALFKQLFSFVNVQLFNQLLLRRECLSFSNGEHVKTGLAQVSVLPASSVLLHAQSFAYSLLCNTLGTCPGARAITILR